MTIRPHAAALAALASFALAACESAPRPQPMAPRPGPIAAFESEVEQRLRYSRPGPRHAALQRLVGEWDVTLEALTEGRAEPQVLARGRCTIRPLHGGRYMWWDTRMRVGEREFDATTLLGWDNTREEFRSATISDLGTGMDVARGEGDLAGDGVLLQIELYDPATQRLAAQRSRLRMLGPDHFAIEVLGPDRLGNERPVHATHYRRRAAAPEPAG